MLKSCFRTASALSSALLILGAPPLFSQEKSIIPSIGRGASPPGFPDRFGRQCASGVMEEQRESGNPQNGIRNGPFAEAG